MCSVSVRHSGLLVRNAKPAYAALFGGLLSAPPSPLIQENDLRGNGKVSVPDSQWSIREDRLDPDMDFYVLGSPQRCPAFRAVLPA